jgi:hypothetical protein
VTPRLSLERANSMSLGALCITSEAAMSGTAGRHGGFGEAGRPYQHPYRKPQARNASDTRRIGLTRKSAHVSGAPDTLALPRKAGASSAPPRTTAARPLREHDRRPGRLALAQGKQTPDAAFGEEQGSPRLDAWNLLPWSCDIAAVPQGIGSAAAYPAGALVLA